MARPSNLREKRGPGTAQTPSGARTSKRTLGPGSHPAEQKRKRRKVEANDDIEPIDETSSDSAIELTGESRARTSRVPAQLQSQFPEPGPSRPSSSKAVAVGQNWHKKTYSDIAETNDPDDDDPMGMDPPASGDLKDDIALLVSKKPLPPRGPSTSIDRNMTKTAFRGGNLSKLARKSGILPSNSISPRLHGRSTEEPIWVDEKDGGSLETPEPVAGPSKQVHTTTAVANQPSRPQYLIPSNRKQSPSRGQDLGGRVQALVEKYESRGVNARAHPPSKPPQPIVAPSSKVSRPSVKGTMKPRQSIQESKSATRRSLTTNRKGKKVETVEVSDSPRTEKFLPLAAWYLGGVSGVQGRDSEFRDLLGWVGLGQTIKLILWRQAQELVRSQSILTFHSKEDIESVEVSSHVVLIRLLTA